MKTESRFFKQLEYPEERRAEKFLTGLAKTWDFKARYIFQLDFIPSFSTTHRMRACTRSESIIPENLTYPPALCNLPTSSPYDTSATDAEFFCCVSS